MRALAIVLLCLAASACQAPSRYFHRQDSAPNHIPADLALHDAQPKFEPYRQVNSRPYNVLGKHYKPLQTGKGYSAVGIASWYGKKFHGHLTSNGESYDMFAMSAAHKTLPLPSYVRVTNLHNSKVAIVRVNDRGPFHDNRIIDLSYAAARKLGVLETGTAPVKLDVIYVDKQGMISVGKEPAITAQQFAQGDEPLAVPIEPPPTKLLYIQVVALQDKSKIEQLAKGLSTLYQIPAQTPVDNNIFRLRLGPLPSEEQAGEVLQSIQHKGYVDAHKVYIAP